MKLTPVMVVLFACFAIAQDRVTVLRGATIWGAGSAPIENGVVVLHRGKIQSVGSADATVPDGARVVDLAGKVITPGLVDAGTTLGWSGTDGNEQGDEITPHLRVLDAVDPDDPRFDRARRNGVTTVQVNPGNRNVIGGLGAVLKTAGATVRDMLVTDESGLRLSMGSEPSSGNRAIRGGTPNSIYYRRPTTRMGVVWEARRAFFAAQEYQQQKTLPDGDDGSAQDPGLDVLVRALDKKLVVHTTARAEQDIRTALRLADEFGYETLVEEATEAWRVIDELAAAGTRVLIAAPSLDDGRDGAEPRWHTIQRLHDAKIPFAIHTGTNLGSLPLVREAMFAQRNGLDMNAALDAVTRVPAEILGIADRVGSLAAGKDADVVVWSTNPFDPTATADHVFVNGEEVDS